MRDNITRERVSASLAAKTKAGQDRPSAGRSQRDLVAQSLLHSDKPCGLRPPGKRG